MVVQQEKAKRTAFGALCAGLAPVWAFVRSLTQGSPTVARAFVCFLVVSTALYLRSPFSNSIFDEQEALLANPYVNGENLGVFQVLERDFWGLPPDRSIGSYRPLPNLIWRGLWAVHDHPWVPHVLNVVLHALNAALVARIALIWSGSRRVGWLSGATFVCSAVLTETVSGAVGLADVLSGTGLILAIGALGLQLGRMALAVFGLCALALFSKESSIAAVAIVPWAALLGARLLHRERPRALLRALVAFAACVCALILYVEVRKRFFPSPTGYRAVDPSAHWVIQGFQSLLNWFAQPRLPHDPINNPLIGVEWPERVATALRIYTSGLGQVLWPTRLSGDYSYAAELPEIEAVSIRSIIGGLLMVTPAVVALVLAPRALGFWGTAGASRARKMALVCLALAIVPVAYFPQSNILVLLPTVRAERFWYLPVVGSSWLLGYALAKLARYKAPNSRAAVGAGGVALFLLVQAAQGRRHAFDYSSDVAFWGATARTSPNSAKAHLNYGVMLGARGDLQSRLIESERALQIAPHWPMANVYTGDTLCRMKRPLEAWPYYKRGFELGPNEPSLIALGLQCLWDQQQFESHQQELLDLADKVPDSWLYYLVHDTIDQGKQHGGVDKKYRPRGYDEGPSH